MSTAPPESAMLVFLDTADGGAIKAIPQNFKASDLLVFSSWRHALAFCDIAGCVVENRNTAELLAQEEGTAPAAPEQPAGRA